MVIPAQSASFAEPMSEKTFNRFKDFIQKELGIKMPDVKRGMLQSRFQKRLRALGLNSYEDYCDYVFSTKGREEEMQNMIDVVTTNKTDFFREPQHFDFLVQKGLPELINSRHGKIARKTGVWSAGCSTGEEPYTLAIVLSEFASRWPDFRFSIFATDISLKVLKEAQRGIYSEEDVAPVPMQIKKKYLLRSKDKNKKLVRIIPGLRARIRFMQLNLMDAQFGIPEPVDVIFCRNVLIYFNRSDQEKIVNRLCRYLNPGGFLFVGHSETLHNMNVPLRSVVATVYRKQ